jgi:RNase P/RNase MRP subunit p29
MSNFTKGQFVKFVGTEDGKEFSYEGQVVSSTKADVTFTTEEGTMTVPASENVTVIAKPSKRVKAVAVKIEKTEPKAEKPVKATRAKRDGSKQEQVNALYAEMVDASRKDVIAKIVSLGITTVAGASTMYANAKRGSK